MLYLCFTQVIFLTSNEPQIVKTVIKLLPLESKARKLLVQGSGKQGKSGADAADEILVVETTTEPLKN